MLALQLLDGLEAGTDEAGRGCLAGPVTAAAVILPKNFKNDILNDSKQLSEKKREILRPIIELEATAFGVAHIFPVEIDKINILNASILGMHKAIDQLSIIPEHIVVDGNKFKPYNKIPHQTIIKGDGKYMNIAAASVLAKTYRDAYMEKIHEEFPMFGLLNKAGEIGFRYSKEVQEKYIKEFNSDYYKSYGATMKGYVLIPDEMLNDIDKLSEYLNESYDYVMSLDPK